MTTAQEILIQDLISEIKDLRDAIQVQHAIYRAGGMGSEGYRLNIKLLNDRREVVQARLERITAPTHPYRSANTS